MATHLEQGMHDSIPMSQYIADPCPTPSVSTGVVQRLVEQTPAHARLFHPRLGGRRDAATEASEKGSAAHAMFAGGDDAIVWVPNRDWKKKAAQEARAAAHADGKTPMLTGIDKDDEYDESKDRRMGLESMAAKAIAFLAPLGAGVFEQTLIWQEGGVWCRARPDWLVGDYSAYTDYKTSKSASPAKWIKNQLQGRPDVQAALVLRGLRAIFGDVEREARWLLQEQDPSYECAWVGMWPNDQLWEFADAKVGWAIQRWGECLAANEFPGYGDEVHWAEPNSWKIQEAVERGIPVPGFT